MRMLVSLAAVAAVSIGLSVGATTAQAVPFDFFQVTNNGSPDITDQLLVDVELPNANQLSFQFFNNVGIDSSLARIYFEDTLGILAGIDSITDSDIPPENNVAFQAGVQGDMGLGGAFSEDFGAHAEPPPSTLGIDNSGEWVKILFDLVNPSNLATILALMASEDLRIGLHVIAFDGSTSEKYINNPKPIPLPAGLVLFLSGLAGIGVLGRYKAKRREVAIA